MNRIRVEFVLEERDGHWVITKPHFESIVAAGPVQAPAPHVPVSAAALAEKDSSVQALDSDGVIICSDHPKYEAKRRPRSGCQVCQIRYDAKHPPEPTANLED